MKRFYISVPFFLTLFSILLFFPNRVFATYCSEVSDTCGGPSGECSEHEVCRCGDKICECQENLVLCPLPDCPYKCLDSCGTGYKKESGYACEGDAKCCSVVGDGCVPGECGVAAECLEGQICKWIGSGVPGWKCRQDTSGECGVNNCPGECKLDSVVGCGQFADKSTIYSCGVINQICCIDKDTPCSSPGSCMAKVALTCPQGYLLADGKCDDTKEICCYDDPDTDNEPQKPKELIYKGPIIDSIDKILNPVVKILYYGGLAIGIFFIVLSGYNLMTSQGDPQKTKEAQEHLTGAILGILFILLSAAILKIIIDQIINI